MKKLIVLLFCLLLCSCAYIDMSTIPSFNSLEEIVAWAYPNIRYVKDKDNQGFRYTQMPCETQLKGIGDCEDIALFVVTIAKQQLNIDCQLIIFEEHCAIYYNDNVYDGYANGNGKEYIKTGLETYCKTFNKKFVEVLPYYKTFWQY